MRHYRTRKAAWDVQKGDLIERDLNGLSVREEVKSVMRMRFTGEFEGVKYQRAPMVRVEYADPAGMFQLLPGDREFNVWRPKGG